MKIRLVDPLDVPVWYCPLKLGGIAYHRADVPSRAAGGLRADVLKVRTADGQTMTVGVRELDRLTRLAVQYGTLDVIGLGRPAIFVSGVCRPDRPLAALLRAIRQAGGVAWLDVDNDLSASAGLPLPTIEFLMAQSDTPPAEARTFLDLDAMFNLRMRARIADHLRASLAALARGQVQTIRAADQVIVSTPTLAAAVRRHHRPVHLGENAIDPFDCPGRAPGREPGQEPGQPVRVGFAGNWGHAADLAEALPALYALAERGDVQLVFIGYHPHMEVARETGWYRFETSRWSYFFVKGTRDYVTYHDLIHSLDIAVAPLQDTPFGRARSASKWLEHSIHRTPMVVSDLPPYAAVRHGETGFKVHRPEEWGHYLRRLVEDSALRQRMGDAARAEVLARHTVAARAPVWQQIIAAAGSGAAE